MDKISKSNRPKIRKYLSKMAKIGGAHVRPSLQCYSVVSDILVKNGLCMPLESGSNVLSTGEGFICISPPSKLKIAVVLSTKRQFRSVL